MIHRYELKVEDIRAYTKQVMMRHFQIEANGYYCKTDILFNLLMKTGAECNSLETACADLEEVADIKTAREYVNKFLLADQLSAQEEATNQTLVECIPKKMARKGIEVVIDFHDEPF